MSICPLGTCAITEPHSHPSLGEGLWEPRPLPVEGEDDLPPLQTVPCRCTCGTVFDGLAFFIKPGPDGYVLRTCDSCADAKAASVERRQMADRRTQRPSVALREAQPLRRPYKDD